VDDATAITIASETDSESSDNNDNGNDNDDDDFNNSITIPKLMNLPAPCNFAQTLQPLLDSKIIFPMDRNENGSHQTKAAFVRGCDFFDYAEIEIWPTDVTTGGAAVRYGFPAIGELTLEATVDQMMEDNNGNSNSNRNSNSNSRKKKKKRVQENPFVLEVDSLGDVRQEIVDAKKDAVLFIG